MDDVIQPGDWREERTCVRCGDTIAPYWRHYLPGCRPCAVWSLLGVKLLAVFGVNAREWLYKMARPWCPYCDGTGNLPCEPQDLHTMQVSGACATCGAYSFELIDAAGGFATIEDSGRHYDAPAEHPVTIRSEPLREAVPHYLDRALVGDA